MDLYPKYRYGFCSHTTTVSTDTGVEYIVFWSVFGTVVSSVAVTTAGGFGTWHS